MPASRKHSPLTHSFDLRNHPKETEEAPSALLEGPYGGIPYKSEDTFDRIILVAGGGGATACLPWLDYLTYKRSDIRVTSVRFLWVVQRREHLDWVADGLEAINKSHVNDGSIEKHYYVTGDASESKRLKEVRERGEADPKKCTARGEQGALNINAGYRDGRPQIGNIIPKLIAEAGRTLAVGQKASKLTYRMFVCSYRPESFKLKWSV
ncbi:MAG: hypothetical protein Q9166_005247 [cf. Caloplaca sp. 2 TL-2023]